MTEGRAVISISIPYKLLASAHDFLIANSVEYPSMSSLVSRSIAEKIKFQQTTINTNTNKQK